MPQTHLLLPLPFPKLREAQRSPRRQHTLIHALLCSSAQLLEETTFGVHRGLIVTVWEFFQRMSLYTHLHFCKICETYPRPPCGSPYDVSPQILVIELFKAGQEFGMKFHA